MYESLYPAAIYGGLGLASRVTNTPAEISAWEARASIRFNEPVHIFAAGTPHNETVPYPWVLEDMVPAISGWHGFQLSPRSVTQGADALLLMMASYNQSGAPANNITTPIPMFGRSVTISGLVSFLGSLSVSFVTPVWFDDAGPTHAVSTITTFDLFVGQVLKASTEAVVVITDHFGTQLIKGSCALASSDQVLELTVSPSANISWTLQIGQCPGYTRGFVTAKRVLIVTVCALFTLSAMGATLLVFDRMETQKRLSEEKSRAHQLMVGYICHELRNPLHIVKTAQVCDRFIWMRMWLCESKGVCQHTGGAHTARANVRVCVDEQIACMAPALT